MISGDHNTQRDIHVTRKSVYFLVQALRYNLPPLQGEGSIAALLGFDAGEVDSCIDRKVLSTRVQAEAARLLATSCPERRGVRLRDVQRIAMSVRLEVAMQLNEEAGEAGFCFGLLPQASDYGGANRPPVVIFALTSPKGLCVTQVVEGSRAEILAQVDQPIDLGVPVLLIAELMDNANHESYFAPPQPTTLRLSLGTGGAEINPALSEEFKRDGFCWPMTAGQAELYDLDLKDPVNHTSSAREAANSGPPQSGQERRLGRRSRRPSQSSTEPDTRGVPSPPPDPPTQEVTSCCRQS